MTGGSRKPSIPKRRRLSGEARRAAIVESATHFFSEHGFGGSTRELAARLGVTQALLYRYFPTKQDLIESVFAAFRGRWDASRANILTDLSIPLEDRLIQFYHAYRTRHGGLPSGRLFMHAAMSGIDLPLRYSDDLDALVLQPVLSALRMECGLPPPPDPMPRDEREMVMGLHGAIVFVGIRRWIYGAAMDDARHHALVSDIIRTWLVGGLARLK